MPKPFGMDSADGLHCLSEHPLWIATALQKGNSLGADPLIPHLKGE